MQISILRLGHRLPRDERISTHVCLVARAFGANEVIYTGQHDGSLESSVLSLAQQWGGDFRIVYEKNYNKVIKEYKNNGYAIVHLSMYGIPLLEKTDKIGTYTKLLIIVGGEQVPKDVYQLADFNIAITNQPHSEVAALAVFLNSLQNNEPLKREYNKKFKGKISIEPSERDKCIKKAE